MSKIYDIGIADIKRVAVLTNPSVNSAEIIKAAAVARQQFNDAGVDVLSVQGRNEEATSKLATEMINNDSIDSLVVCGDDGLINIVLQAQANSTTPMGIIPAGETTDLGRSLNIPLNPRRAADIIMRGFYTTTDLGTIRTSDQKSRWFATIACSGFDARVVRTSHRFSGRLKALRAPLGALVELPHFKASTCRITLDDHDVIKDNILMVAVGNTKYYGQGIMICPGASHHDGLFDITVIPETPLKEALRSFPKLYQRKSDGIEQAWYYKARKIKIEHPGLPNAADCREFSYDFIEAEVVEGAGRFLVPRP